MIALLLAQSAPDAPDAESLRAWLGVALYLLGILAAVLGVLVLWKQWREKAADPLPQPLTVTEHIAPIGRPEFEKAIKEAHGRMNREKAERDAEVAAMKDATAALREKVDREVAGMRDLVDEAHAAGEARANRIHDRIDTLGKQVADMPERIVGLLSNARGL